MGATPVSWGPSSPSAGVRYELFESFNGGAWIERHDGTSRSRSFSGKSDGSYRYRARACLRFCSGYNSIRTVTVLKRPTTPSITQLPNTTSTGQFEIRWSAAQQTIDRYRLEQRIGNSGSWALIATVGSAVRSRNLSYTWNETYHFRVRAENGSGASAWSSSRSTVVARPPDRPVITGPNASNSGDYAISFAIVQPPNEYVVERAVDASNYVEVARGSSSSYTEAVLVDGAYGYRVKAFNTYGESAWSTVHVVDVALTPEAVVDDSPVVTLPYPVDSDNVGTIEGAASVSGGAASYRMMLQVPPGRRGMTPDVALVYSSRQTGGIAGMGWGLSVTSRIHRCQQTPASDDDSTGSGVSARFRGIDYTADDRLCLNGERLVLMSTGASYGMQGTEYRKEIDDRTRVRIASGSFVSPHAEFEVDDGNGNISYYGGSAGDDSAIFTPFSAPAPDAWAIRRAEDPQGNFIRYTYRTQYQQHLLEEIRLHGA